MKMEQEEHTDEEEKDTHREMPTYYQPGVIP